MIDMKKGLFVLGMDKEEGLIGQYIPFASLCIQARVFFMHSPHSFSF